MLGRRFLCGYRALLLLVLFSVSCHGNQNQQLIGNSCGDIHNITFPFQLQSDAQSCGINNYTLACDNNRTVLSLYSGKYYVQAINHNNYTIRLVDVGIQSNNICTSFPLRYLTPYNFTYGDPYSLHGVSYLVFLTCENPVKSPIYINRTAYCDNGVDFSSLKGYSYVLAGQVKVWDIADSCSFETMVISSSPLLIESESESKFSFLDANEALAYGFEVSWEFNTRKSCKKSRGGNRAVLGRFRVVSFRVRVQITSTLTQPM